MNSNRKGAIAEAMIAAEATKLGVPVLKPMAEHERYDLALELGGRILRVQVKWANHKGDVLCVHLTRCRTSRRGYVREKYLPGEVDVFAAYCGKLDRCYLIPGKLGIGRSAIQLRLTPTRNGQRAALNWAADYEMRGAVAQLEEHHLGKVGVVGSSPISSTLAAPTETQQVEVGAHIFRNRFGYYMECAAAGEEITVSRRGKPHVRLVPASG
jgi:prevent-host-death family protein